MKQKKRFYLEFVAKKTRRERVIHLGLVLVIFAIVLYDSFVHNLPFYYVLFALAGLSVQRVYRASRRIAVDEDDGVIHERPGLAWIFVVAVLALRVLYGSWALKKLHVVWLSDALYLFALGLHFARVRSIAGQVDELVYGFVIRSKRESHPESNVSEMGADHLDPPPKS